MSNFVIKNGVLEKCTGHAERVVIPDNVTTIGEKAFSKNPFIKFVKIVELPDSVTTIEACAFTGCPSLASIHIPESVTTIGEYAFAGCSALASISIPNSVTTLEKCVFAGCSALTSVDIPNSVTTIKYYAFAGCSALTSVNIPNSVTTIGDSAFYSCTALTSIYIPDSVTSIEKSAFADCYNLKEVSLPETITVATAAFPATTKIIYRKLEEQFAETPEISTEINSEFIFDEEELIINAAERKQLQLSEDFIIEHDVLKLYIGNPENVSNQNEMKLIIPEGVKFIGECAFARCLNLSSIEIPDSVVGIRDCAFALCSHLTEITLPKNICLGEQVFYECPNLTVIKIRFPNNIVGTFEKPALDTMFQKL